MRAERQLAYHIADTLSHYFRTHLVLHATGLQRRLAPASFPKQVLKSCALWADGLQRRSQLMQKYSLGMPDACNQGGKACL